MVLVDQTSSMDDQVMLHQVATISSLKRVPTTIFRRTRSKLVLLFHHKQVWKKLGLPNFCQEIVNGYRFHPLPISITNSPKSDCMTKEVQGSLLDGVIEQVLLNRSKRIFTPKCLLLETGTTLHRPVLYLKRLKTYINNQSFKMG
ncbi:hypothetical protein ACTFIR_003971 [Dictyostelium discoideum]